MYSVWVCVYRCVYANRNNGRGTWNLSFEGATGVEGNHESENVERKSGIKVFENGSDTAQEKSMIVMVGW
jgi:hypothetical protein